MNRPTNYHVFAIKYLGATDTKGSRVKITSQRFEQSVTISYNYEYSNIYEMAQEKLESMGYEITGMGETPSGYVLMSTTFEPLKMTIKDWNHDCWEELRNLERILNPNNGHIGKIEYEEEMQMRRRASEMRKVEKEYLTSLPF